MTILHSVTVTEDSASEDPRVVLRAAFFKGVGAAIFAQAGLRDLAPLSNPSRRMDLGVG